MEVNRLQQKVTVTVTGEVDPVVVLRPAEGPVHGEEGGGAVDGPHNTAGCYAPAAVALYRVGPAQLQAHDGRWADPYPVSVRSVEADIGAEQISRLFSDGNRNACSQWRSSVKIVENYITVDH